MMKLGLTITAALILGLCLFIITEQHCTLIERLISSFVAGSVLVFMIAYA